MTTFADLTNDVLLLMEGYGLNQDRAAFISTVGGITATDLSFTVDSVANLGPGLAEIEDELVYIQSVDDSTDTVTISPDGRGYRGTVAAVHGQNVRVTMNPVLPRTLVKRKINDTIVGLYPNIFGVDTATLTYDPVVVAYQLPAAVEEVLQVTYQPIGPSKMWCRAERWNVDHNSDPTAFPNGKVLNLFDGLWPGTEIRVVYRKQPTELAADADDLTASGLASTARAVVVAGAAWRLASFMDAARLPVAASTPDAQSDKNPIGTGTQVSSYLFKQYEIELQNEKERQQLAVPPVMHFTE